MLLREVEAQHTVLVLTCRRVHVLSACIVCMYCLHACRYCLHAQVRACVYYLHAGVHVNKDYTHGFRVSALECMCAGVRGKAAFGKVVERLAGGEKRLCLGYKRRHLFPPAVLDLCVYVMLHAGGHSM